MYHLIVVPDVHCGVDRQQKTLNRSIMRRRANPPPDSISMATTRLLQAAPTTNVLEYMKI